MKNIAAIHPTSRERYPMKTFLISALLFLTFAPHPVSAQTKPADELTEPLRAINQKSILATISFLASDELAGRDTPSPELDIAAAYVAARFRGAGLKGGGPDGSFYLTNRVATVQVPTTGIRVLRNGHPIAHYGLLAGDAEPFSFQGQLTFVSPKDDFRKTHYTGPVCFLADKLDQPRAISNLIRQTAVLKRNGATAILIPVEANSPLVQLAQRAARPSLVRPRGGFAGPTLLIANIPHDGQFQIDLPRQTGGEAEVRNVIGILPGSDPQRKHEAIIFSAHLDHLGTRSGKGDTVFNGADDDASGVTAVLTLADAYAALKKRPQRTIIFMTFWGEEKGLLGSRAYARHPAWPLKQTVANINIEMIGRPEPGGQGKVWMTGWYQSDLGDLMNRGAQSVGVPIFEHRQFSAMLYRASDNYSLAEKGVIAHSFSAGSLHGDYHQVTDHWQKLNLRHMQRVIEGLFAGSLPIANGDVTPKKKTE